MGTLFTESSFNGEMEAEYHCWGGYMGCPGDGEGEYLKEQQDRVTLYKMCLMGFCLGAWYTARDCRPFWCLYKS